MYGVIILLVALPLLSFADMSPDGSFRDWSCKKITSKNFARSLKYSIQRYAQEPKAELRQPLFATFDKLTEKCPDIKGLLLPKFLIAIDLIGLGQSETNGDSIDLSKAAQEEVKKAMESLQEQKRKSSSQQGIGNIFGSGQSLEFIKHRDKALIMFLAQLETDLLTKLTSCQETMPSFTRETTSKD